MALVYNRVGKHSVDRWVAGSEDCQEGLFQIVNTRAAIASMILQTAPKNRTGDSVIRVEQGETDWFVVLDDTRGLKAALSIEFGRRAYRIGARRVGENEYGKNVRGEEVTDMEGIRPLGIAFGLEERERF